MVKRLLIGAASFICGLISYVIVGVLFGVVLQFVVSIPFVGTILSYPSTPMLYVLTFSLTAGAFASSFVCERVAGIMSMWIPRVLFYGYMTLGSIVPAIREFLKNGFTDYFWAISVVAVLYAVFFCGTWVDKNKDVTE